MSTFTETEHPRGAAGKFVEKPQSDAEVNLQTSSAKTVLSAHIPDIGHDMFPQAVPGQDSAVAARIGMYDAWFFEHKQMNRQSFDWEVDEGARVKVLSHDPDGAVRIHSGVKRGSVLLADDGTHVPASQFYILRKDPDTSDSTIMNAFHEVDEQLPNLGTATTDTLPETPDGKIHAAYVLDATMETDQGVRDGRGSVFLATHRQVIDPQESSDSIVSGYLITPASFGRADSEPLVNTVQLNSVGISELGGQILDYPDGALTTDDAATLSKHVASDYGRNLFHVYGLLTSKPMGNFGILKNPAGDLHTNVRKLREEYGV